MPFSIALSGLNAASNDLKVTGNNIANASTNGFKSSRTEFSDVFAASSGGVSATAIGGGVRLTRVAQEFAQGNIEFTSNNLDLAINGEGFFILSDSGSQVYTRAGAYSIDKDGYAVNSNGQRLQVFAPIGNSGTVFNTGSLSDLQVSLTEGSPQATSTIDINANMQADDTAPTSNFSPSDASTYNYSTSFTVYDSQGSEHTASIYLRKLDPSVDADASSNQWIARMYLDGTSASDVVTVDRTGGSHDVDPTTGDLIPTATSAPGAGELDFILEFNADGTLNTSATNTLNGANFASTGILSFENFTLSNGASAMSLDMDFSDVTQYGSDYAVFSLSQDGFATGRLSGLSVSEEGVISARFTNGQSNPLGKIALATFPNTGDLRQLGDTTWSETFDSGAALIGEAGTASFGLVQSGALESSNVDIAKELIKLITAQRNFQANSQVISTADTITQTIINIR